MRDLVNRALTIGIVACLLLPLGYAQGLTQKVVRLPDYLASLQWDVASNGPLIAVSPPTRQIAGATGFASFGRKVLKVGGISAVVPIKMVTIDDSMKAPPNLYDGLPREAKALYLLTTLDDSQLRKATGAGIGLSDLREDQRPVFRSLLPARFKWDRGVVGKNFMPVSRESGTLTDKERDLVRLRYSKAINFQVGLADGSRGYTFHSTTEDYGDVGDIAHYRDDSDDFDRTEAFGVQIRKEEDNRLKKSHLDYEASSLQTLIALKPSETIGSLVQRLGDKVGLDIIAEMRIKDLPVKCFGASAKVSEALQAICLGVTGTFRNVGGTYVLTSDLVGMGTRKLRLSVWQSEIHKEVWRRMSQWREQGKANGIFNKINFQQDDPVVPDSETKALLDKFEPANGHEAIDTGTLPHNLRAFLDRTNSRYSSQQVRTDRVSMEISVHFGFILPDGTTLKNEKEAIASASLLRYSNQIRPPVDLSLLRPIAIAPIRETRGLAIHLANLSDVEGVVPAALSYGFNEVWVETRSSKILEAICAEAKPTNIAVRLVVQPWRANQSTSPSQLDRTIAGSGAAELNALFKSSSLFKEFSETSLGSALMLQAEPNIPPGAGSEAQFEILAGLARNPNLAGIALWKVRPRGYESNRAGTYYQEGVISESLNFGYSLEVRRAFLRQYSSDPIDLAPPHLFFDSDLRQPFFLDDNLRGSSSVYDGRDIPVTGFESQLSKWSEFLANRLDASLTRLLSRLRSASPSNQVCVEVTHSTVNPPSSAFRVLTPWELGSPLPQFEDPHGMQFQQTQGSVVVLPLFDGLPDRETQLWHQRYATFSRPDLKQPAVLDATGLSIQTAMKLIARTFERKAQP